MIAFSNSKINLGLHILNKRKDGFHNIETVFYPIPLQDGIEIIHNPSPSADAVHFSSSGVPIHTPASRNLCVKAYQLLKKDFPELPAVQIHLHKVIPVSAGLGGGSSNAAFTLLLLNKKFNLQIPKEKLTDYALELGSDCPFFIVNKPCYATGRGEIMQEIPVDISAYKLLIVNPNIPVSTAWAFSQITPDADRTSLKEIINLPVDKWKVELHNDFEEPVFSHHPEIKNIRDELYAHGAIYASMSGSGSTVFGLFEKASPLPSFPHHYFTKVM